MTKHGKFGDKMDDRKAVERMNNRNQIEPEGMYNKLLRGLKNPRSKLLVLVVGSALALYGFGFFDKPKAPVREDYMHQNVPTLVNKLNCELVDRNNDGSVDTVIHDDKTMYVDTNQIDGPEVEGMLEIGVKRMTPAQVGYFTKKFNEYNLNKFRTDSLRFKNKRIMDE